MLRTWIGLGLVGATLAACAPQPVAERTPYLPPGIYGVYLDNDTGAINQAAWAFASPANTRDDPADAAKAVVALEYLPGELTDNPRWVGMSASVKLRMAQARDQVQDILGINPTAPRQQVVNALLAVAWNTRFGNTQGALAALNSPAFTFGPEKTLHILSNLPYIQEANLSTARAQEQEQPPGGARG